MEQRSNGFGNCRRNPSAVVSKDLFPFADLMNLSTADVLTIDQETPRWQLAVDYSWALAAFEGIRFPCSAARPDQ